MALNTIQPIPETIQPKELRNTLELIEFRVHEVMDDTTCPQWCDMLNVLRDILSVFRETRNEAVTQ